MELDCLVDVVEVTPQEIVAAHDVMTELQHPVCKMTSQESSHPTDKNLSHE
jgi:hypothetical protein